MAVQIPNEAWWQAANTAPNASSAEKNLATVRQNMTKTVPFPFVVGLSDSTDQRLRAITKQSALDYSDEWFHCSIWQ
jgi:hypothetical protein